MAEFSAISASELATCDNRLVRLFTAVIGEMDCQVIQGARSPMQEGEAIVGGRSHLKDPMNSMHVTSLENPKSRAVDVVPYPLVWPDKNSPQYVHQIGRFYYFAGIVRTIARELDIKVRWGGDWDQDLDFSDQTFDDLDHWELTE